MIKPLLIASAILLSGCSTLEQNFPEPTRDSSFINFNVVDEFPVPMPENVAGYAQVNNGLCLVYVLKEYYPYGVVHEISHCMSGNWHEGRDSSEYFYFVE